MPDDFSNLRNLKKPPIQPAEKGVNIKQPASPRPSQRICFIITKNKNSSWIDDLHAQQQLNQMDRIFH